MASQSRICDLLRTFPINYPVADVIVSGQEQDTSNFVNFDSATGVAVFRNNGELVVFDCDRIDGLVLNNNNNG